MFYVPVKKLSETHKHYIKRLKGHIELLVTQYITIANNKDTIINELKDNNVVSKLEHDTALAKIEELRAALKKYGLWTGQ